MTGAGMEGLMSSADEEGKERALKEEAAHREVFNRVAFSMDPAGNPLPCQRINEKSRDLHPTTYNVVCRLLQQYHAASSKKDKTAVISELSSQLSRSIPTIYRYLQSFYGEWYQTPNGALHYRLYRLRRALKQSDIDNPNHNWARELSEAKVALCSTDVFDVIKEAHHTFLANTKGSNSLHFLVKRKYWNISEDHCKLFISFDKNSNTRKPQVKQVKGARKPIISKRFRERFQVDLIDMRSKPCVDPYGVVMCWILVCKDHHTKFVYLCPLPKKSAYLVAYELNKIFSLLGCPNIFHTDNGGEFVGKVVVYALKQLNPMLLCVSGQPRNPRVQGSVENINQHVKEALARCEQADLELNIKPNWVKYLPRVMMTLNGKANKNSRVPPYDTVIGMPLVNYQETGVKTEDIRKCTSIHQIARLTGNDADIALARQFYQDEQLSDLLGGGSPLEDSPQPDLVRIGQQLDSEWEENPHRDPNADAFIGIEPVNFEWDRIPKDFDPRARPAGTRQSLPRACRSPYKMPSPGQNPQFPSPEPELAFPPPPVKRAPAQQGPVPPVFQTPDGKLQLSRSFKADSSEVEVWEDPLAAPAAGMVKCGVQSALALVAETKGKGNAKGDEGWRDPFRRIQGDLTCNACPFTPAPRIELWEDGYWDALASNRKFFTTKNVQDFAMLTHHELHREDILFLYLKTNLQSVFDSPRDKDYTIMLDHMQHNCCLRQGQWSGEEVVYTVVWDHHHYAVLVAFPKVKRVLVYDGLWRNNSSVPWEEKQPWAVWVAHVIWCLSETKGHFGCFEYRREEFDCGTCRERGNMSNAGRDRSSPWTVHPASDRIIQQSGTECGPIACMHIWTRIYGKQLTEEAQTDKGARAIVSYRMKELVTLAEDGQCLHVVVRRNHLKQALEALAGDGRGGDNDTLARDKHRQKALAIRGEIFSAQAEAMKERFRHTVNAPSVGTLVVCHIDYRECKHANAVPGVVLASIEGTGGVSILTKGGVLKTTAGRLLYVPWEKYDALDADREKPFLVDRFWSISKNDILERHKEGDIDIDNIEKTYGHVVGLSAAHQHEYNFSPGRKKMCRCKPMCFAATCLCAKHGMTCNSKCICHGRCNICVSKEAPPQR